MWNQNLGPEGITLKTRLEILEVFGAHGRETSAPGPTKNSIKNWRVQDFDFRYDSQVPTTSSGCVMDCPGYGVISSWVLMKSKLKMDYHSCSSLPKTIYSCPSSAAISCSGLLVSILTDPMYSTKDRVGTLLSPDEVKKAREIQNTWQAENRTSDRTDSSRNRGHFRGGRPRGKSGHFNQSHSKSRSPSRSKSKAKEQTGEDKFKSRSENSKQPRGGSRSGAKDRAFRLASATIISPDFSDQSSGHGGESGDGARASFGGRLGLHQQYW